MYRSSGSSASSSGSFLDVESIIRGLTQDYSTAFNTGNYDQVAALFSADGTFMPPNHESAQGPRAIEHILAKFGDAGYQDLRFETVRVDHSGDMAVETGRYSVVIQQGNGTVIADRGKFVHGWRRLGAWLIIADSWSSNLPVMKSGD